MASNRFQNGVVLRVAALAATLALLGWMATQTSWYVSTLIFLGIAIAQVAGLIRFTTRASQEVARFLDAIAFDDTSASFSGLMRDGSFRDLGASMTRVLNQLRQGRQEQEEQAQYLQSLLAHIPIALIAIEEDGGVQLLNVSARRLFGEACTHVSTFARYGEAFAAGLETLTPGDGAIIRMDRGGATLPLKASLTQVMLRGRKRRLVSLQNIATELSSHELAAWQTVIRVMAHEVMNSLTPITSLASTARDHIGETIAQLPADNPARPGLEDAAEALATLARRSEGLLQFVANQRRITKRMVAQIQIVPVERVFVRLQRLLADELKTRDIAMSLQVEPPTLEIAADIDLLDQALINLVRNAMEALRDTQGGRIGLQAAQESGGRVVLSVIDNGPGVPPDQREKVFVPFFTTKRQGSGIGLSLVRQIAAVHNGNVAISDTPGGGATITVRF
jgi:nitrogen fixation/metabolism regulation signal transduction histidine kinase